MSSIYVQIASYRDPDLWNTINDLISNSSKKHKITIGVIDQYCEKDNDEDVVKNFKKLKVSNFCKLSYDRVHFTETKGVCWVRHLLNLGYSGEDYTLQLDSHHRFIKNWDTVSIKMLKDLKKKGHKKPLLTTYCPSFIQQTERKHTFATQMDFDRFTPEGAVFFSSGVIPDWENKTLPVPSKFISGHMIFTQGNFCKEVIYDPYYLFHGEEINLTVRAFTHGYDLFHPHKPVVYHEYSRSHRPRKCWDDDPSWNDKNIKSHLRNRKFFEMDGEKKDIDFAEFDLGKERSIEDYEEYSGVRMRTRSVQQHTLDLKHSPNPLKKTDKNYDASFLQIFKHCIDLGYDQVPLDDYDFWCVAFKNENDEDIYREDADSNEINQMKSDPDGYCKLWRVFEVGRKPHSWLVWPHSESKGWLNPIVGQL
jgi:hypothetical protein